MQSPTIIVELVEVGTKETRRALLCYACSKLPPKRKVVGIKKWE
jgi:hypothetical protein